MTGINGAYDFWATLARWQNLRLFWFIFAFCALGIEIFSWLFFQKFLGLFPCELCVYIRFSMVVIFLGAMVATINPQKFALKFGGILIVIWGVVRGLIWNTALYFENNINPEEHLMSGCSLTALKFPFNLPLAEWLPSHFMPLALCGQDSKWSWLGFDMSQWLFVIYGLFSVVTLLIIFSWVIIRRGKDPLSQLR
ncbi:MAG: disulfide bond formation protein B [Candidatus Adiutrix sp.]